MKETGQLKALIVIRNRNFNRKREDMDLMKDLVNSRPSKEMKKNL